MSQPLVEPRPPRGSSVLTKAISTAAVGTLTFFVTNGFPNEKLWQITLSVLLGSVTLVVQFIWDFDRRVQYMEERQLRHYASMNDLVQEGFSKISEATELFGLVEHSVLHNDQITQLVRYATRIKAEPQLFYDIGQSEINRVARFLKELGDGPRRYGELDRSIAGSSKKMLTQTLRDLERDGLVTRVVERVTPPSVHYQLTALGVGLLQAMQVVVDWAEQHDADIDSARAAFDAGRHA